MTEEKSVIKIGSRRLVSPTDSTCEREEDFPLLFPPSFSMTFGYYRKAVHFLFSLWSQGRCASIVVSRYIRALSVYFQKTKKKTKPKTTPIGRLFVVVFPLSLFLPHIYIYIYTFYSNIHETSSHGSHFRLKSSSEKEKRKENLVISTAAVAARISNIYIWLFGLVSYTPR